MANKKVASEVDSSTTADQPGESAAAADPSGSRLAAATVVTNYPRVIIYRVKKKKGRKKKYTAGLKDLQRFAHGVTDSSERLSRALSRGVVRYRKSQNKSARKKRDGGITDFVDNWSKGASKGLRIASRAPRDLTRRVNTKPYTRFIRSTTGVVLSPFFR